jgi:exopolysaccharide biosynthesis polyprenyl glycosylphosphotransferase
MRVSGVALQGGRAWGRITATRLSLHISERKILLACGDVGCWLGVAAINSREHELRGPLLLGLVVSLVVWCVATWVNGAYDGDTATRPASVLRATVNSALVVGLVFGVLAYLSRGSVGRFEWATTLFTAVLLILVWRLVYIRLFTLPVFTRRLLFAGVEPVSEELAQLIRRRWSPQLAIVGFLDARGRGRDSGAPGGLGDALSTARTLEVSEIVASPRAIEDPQDVSYLVDCTNAGFKVTPSPLLYEELLKRVPVSEVDHRWILDLARGAFADRTYLGTKRLVDIVLASAGLAVLAVLFPFVALAILLDSGRPFLYRQRRVGAGGRAFTLTKFRTMRQDAENGTARWSQPGDCRVTRVGRILRRSRIDELPQVLNILRGEMSVVGPRPERPEFVQKLAEEIPFYNTRHAVKPGLSGWAQINQGYGDSVDDARTKLEYDLYYVRRQSLLLDALIVLRTIGIVLHLRGR